jgi:hypothetical protein
MQQYIQQLAKNSASGLKYDGAFGFANGDNSNLSVNLGSIGGNQIVANHGFAGSAFFNAPTLNATPETVRTLSSFTGGFSVLLNNTPFSFNNNVIGNDLLPHQIVLSNGVAGGGNTNPNYSVWGHPGFEDSADILVNVTPPVSTPEPSSIILLGVGFAGILAGYRRKRKESATA